MGHLQDDSHFEIKYINFDEFDFNSAKIDRIKPEQLTINSKKFIDILSIKFEQNNLAKKNTVTQIMADEEHYNISNLNYNKTDKLGDQDFLGVGTAYHKYMQYINFSNDENNICEQIKKMKDIGIISTQESNLVDESKIVKAVLQVCKLINNRDVVSKEKQFLAYMPANELVNTNKENKILIQGVADLIIIKDNEIYLIDYKTSRLNNDMEFVNKYSTQLNIYAKAIEHFYGLPVTKKAIYSFYLDKLIII